jgi:hypothetical protein
LTAWHCLETFFGQTIYVADSNNQLTTATISSDNVRSHPRSGPGALNYVDVAMLRMTTPMNMYNSNGQLSGTGYSRGFYWGADSALQGTGQRFCQGAGPGGVNAQTTVGWFNLYYVPTESTDIDIHGNNGNSSGMDLVSGDSGGSCMEPRYDHASRWVISYVNRGWDGPYNVSGHGAAQWRDWAFGVLWNGWGW